MRIRRLFEVSSLAPYGAKTAYVGGVPAFVGLIWMYSHPLTCKHDESAYISISAVNSNRFYAVFSDFP